jgi:hypothetical protein
VTLEEVPKLVQERLTNVGTVARKARELVDHAAALAEASGDPAMQDVARAQNAFLIWIIEEGNEGGFSINLREQMRSACKLLVQDGDMTPAATQQIMNVFDQYGL